MNVDGKNMNIWGRKKSRDINIFNRQHWNKYRSPTSHPIDMFFR
jgi:hypothetical protein